MWSTKNMGRTLSVGSWFVLVILVTLNYAADICRYGSTADCLFPCHCTRGCDPVSGACINGGECPLAKPEAAGIRQSGPGCTFANQALYKSAKQGSGTFDNLAAGLAVDGVVTDDDRKCAHPQSVTGSPYIAWWMVDLGEDYAVTSLILFNRDDTKVDGSYKRLGKFRVFVTRSEIVNPMKALELQPPSDICLFYEKVIDAGGNGNITCESPIVGRYVYIVRDSSGYQKHYMSICEALVFGKQHVDCTEQCAQDCNVLTGCNKCKPGFYYPDCQTECSLGTFGDHCQQECHSNCKYQCQITNGTCIGGCKEPGQEYMAWYIGDFCEQELSYVEYDTSNAINLTVEDRQINVEFFGSTIDRQFTEFIKYRLQLRTNNHVVLKTVDYTDPSFRHEFSDLSRDTTYYISVSIVRFLPNGHTEQSRHNSSYLKIKTPVPPTTAPVTQRNRAAGPDDIESDGNNLGFIGGGAAAAVAIILVIIVVVLLVVRKKRNEKNSKSYGGMNGNTGIQTDSVETGLDNAGLEMDEGTNGNVAEEKTKGVAYVEFPNVPTVAVQGTCIKVENLEAYIGAKKHTEDGLKREFKELSEGRGPDACTVAGSPQISSKNRFKNIWPYDDNRVILEDENPDETYINASYLKGYPEKDRHYIATQGPKPNTTDDFWRMVWQEDSRVIVMVTNVNEGGRIKCATYWPGSVGETKTCGDIRIDNRNTDTYSDYQIITLSVTHQDKTRQVKHFQFTSWPDKLCPDHAFPLLEFRRKVRLSDGQNRGPMIVHCSAGIGRTGTFIAIDYLLDQIRREGKFDACSLVRRMRNERSHMVQTVAQYIFVYDAILDGHKSGATGKNATALDRANFKAQYNILLSGHEYSNETPIEEQFKALRSLVVGSYRPGENSGLKGKSVQKNRDPGVVPDNNRRLHLTLKVPGTDNYINAVYTKTFDDKRLVVTQIPLKETVVDFWRLVYEQRCTTLISLETVESPVCWPMDNDSKLTFGGLTVTAVSVGDKSGQCELRRYIVAYESKHTTETVEVQHIIFSKWANSQSLPDKDDMLNFLSAVADVQKKSEQGKTLVQCLNGAKRCGLFCSASYILEALRVDHEANVFLGVRYVSLPRPEFIQTLDQYKYLHELVLESSNKNDIYQNY